MLVFAVHRKLWKSDQFREVAWELLMVQSFSEDPERAEALGLADVAIMTPLNQIFRHEPGPEADRALIWTLVKLIIISHFNLRLVLLSSSMTVTSQANPSVISRITDQFDSLLKKMGDVCVEQEVHMADVFRLMAPEECADGNWLMDPSTWFSSIPAVAGGLEVVTLNSTGTNWDKVRDLTFIPKDDLDRFINDPGFSSSDTELKRRCEHDFLEYLDELGVRNMDRLLKLVNRYAPNPSLRFVWSKRVNTVQILRLQHLKNVLPRPDREWTAPKCVLDVCSDGTVPLLDATVAKYSCDLAASAISIMSVLESVD
jgi:hypothetical protein